MPRTYGHQPSLQPPRTEPGPPPAPASAITYEGIVFSRELGRGITITTAPQHSKISVGLLIQPTTPLRQYGAGALIFADQVAYEITGYDPVDDTLTLRLTHDWRPGQKDAPTEPAPQLVTADIDITPYLVVHRYRTDHNSWAWAVRCWGDGTCDGHLALDLSDRAYAERKARAHLTEQHPDHDG